MNTQIRAKEVRLIGEEGEQLGILTLKEALKLAEEQGLDLVEVASNSNPVVCKVMDYGKYKYDKLKKQKEAKKNQKIVVTKEIKIKTRIDKHDLEVKKNRIDGFLEKGYKVKVSLMLYGREKSHTELGIEILESVIESFKEKADVERRFTESEAQKFIILTSKNNK